MRLVPSTALPNPGKHPFFVTRQRNLPSQTVLSTEVHFLAGPRINQFSLYYSTKCPGLYAPESRVSTALQRSAKITSNRCPGPTQDIFVSKWVLELKGIRVTRLFTEISPFGKAGRDCISRFDHLPTKSLPFGRRMPRWKFVSTSGRAIGLFVLLSAIFSKWSSIVACKFSAMGFRPRSTPLNDDPCRDVEEQSRNFVCACVEKEALRALGNGFLHIEPCFGSVKDRRLDPFVSLSINSTPVLYPILQSPCQRDGHPSQSLHATTPTIRHRSKLWITASSLVFLLRTRKKTREFTFHLFPTYIVKTYVGRATYGVKAIYTLTKRHYTMDPETELPASRARMKERCLTPGVYTLHGDRRYRKNLKEVPLSGWTVQTKVSPISKNISIRGGSIVP
ncbi:uncharacterized protein BDR25DRAFT_359118 [Lindgomyces ingoldianus]|uniref:Uncharacterized protein n=1 Tax=Lindgomyces ingoldianus TaxID=673940 RepID=A0ACB6QJL0_9PLEO|nr:uncharacterized protein BDR25DRAFT_359118 [Lindgomyces ingoldianus]KAF2467085.1 hypothetical protein BDR25DRAFT_359118 [Lindgomyces ingoldianus]